jgi:hypothetical protein
MLGESSWLSLMVLISGGAVVALLHLWSRHVMNPPRHAHH